MDLWVLLPNLPILIQLNSHWEHFKREKGAETIYKLVERLCLHD